MGFPRQEHWSGLPFPSPGDLSDPGIKSMSPVLGVNSLLLSHQGSPHKHIYRYIFPKISMVYGRKLGKDYEAIMYPSSFSYNKVERFRPQPN